MNESKIVATKRLQSEGRWNEASLYREEVREHLRGEGMTRKEANKGASLRCCRNNFGCSSCRPKYYEGIDGKMDYDNPIISGHIPVKRKK